MSGGRDKSTSKQQKRSVLLTVLVLIVVVLGVYLSFIGRAFMTTPAT